MYFLSFIDLHSKILGVDKVIDSGFLRNFLLFLSQSSSILFTYKSMSDFVVYNSTDLLMYVVIRSLFLGFRTSNGKRYPYRIALLLIRPSVNRLFLRNEQRFPVEINVK